MTDSDVADLIREFIKYAMSKGYGSEWDQTDIVEEFIASRSQIAELQRI